MVGRSRTRSFVTQFGPNHWKVITGPEFAVRIVPRRLYGLGWATLGITVAVIAAVWLAPAVPLEGKIASSIIGAAGGVMVTAFCIFLDRYEQELGSYLVLDRDGVRLRQGLHVRLEDLAAFEVKRRWELTGDGETPVVFLVLRTKGAEEFEILASVCGREVFELKRLLDENVSRILAAKSVPNSSSD